MFEVSGVVAGNIPYSLLKFSGGELHPKLLKNINGRETAIHIHGNITSSDDLMELALLVDALRRSAVPCPPITASIPYFPYARQDRACAQGESLAVKVACDFINSLNFVSVEVWDAHSDVTTALLNRSINRHQKEFVSRIKWQNTVLVAPDAGAIKKILEIAKLTSMSVVRADKIRSVEDGSITGTVVYSEHIGNKDFLIADDICDGGRTFIELAKVLRPLTTGKIYLYVTHGIFSKGLDVFNGLIDGVYTANPFPDVDISHKLLTII